MKVPRRVSNLLKEKQEFIDLYRDKLEKSVVKLQERLLSDIINEIIPYLDVKNGVIQDTVHNYRLMGDLDKVYKNFSVVNAQIITAQVVKATSGIISLTKDYFVAVNADISARFENILEAAANKINLRIGIEGGKIVRGGFMDSFLSDTTLKTEVTNYISKSITGQVSMKEFTSGLQTIVTGRNVPGGLEKQFQRYTFDLYQQYDRAYSSSLADEFGMKYFLYQGGIIEDSRDFCVANNGKVWSREEAETWPTWTPRDGVYPAGYVIKQKLKDNVPSYLGYPGYQPLIDAGGYNCRHSIGFIPDEMAFDLRPDLKDEK